MNKYLKYFLVGLIILYIVSPVDLIPGPLDDILLAVGLIYKLLASRTLPQPPNEDVIKNKSQVFSSSKKTKSPRNSKAEADPEAIFDDAVVVEGEIIQEIPKKSR